MDAFNSDQNAILKLFMSDLYKIFMGDPRNYSDELHARACRESSEVIIIWIFNNLTALELEQYILSRVIFRVLRVSNPLYLSILDRLSTQASKWLVINQLRIILSQNPAVVKGGTQ